MKNYAHLIFAAVLFIIVLGGYWMWYGALSAKSAEVSALSAEVAAQGATEAEASAASLELSKLNADEAVIGTYFVDPANVVSFLEGLQSIGTVQGAKVSVVSVTAQTSPAPHLDLALTAEGSFNAVLSTAGAIEYAPYDIEVTGLTLDAAPPAVAGGPAWTAAMTLSVGTATSSAATTTP